MHEMYAVTALPADKIKNQWDIFTSSPAVPGPNEDLEVIAATKEENSCTFRAKRRTRSVAERECSSPVMRGAKRRSNPLSRFA